MSDIRVQDAVLEHPMVRALIVPECDMAARRRCIALITNVIKAANPVLHFLLQYQEKSADKQTRPAHPAEPPKELLTHFKLLTHFLCTVPASEHLVRFWLKHYELELEGQIKSYGESVYEKLKESLPAPPTTATALPSDTNPDALIRRMSLISLYSKIRKARDILQDLADRVQGAVCIVFWESWDATYQYMAEIVGDSAMRDAENGRIFRPSGAAAIYINRRKVEERTLLHRQQRILMQEKENRHRGSSNGGGGASQDIMLTPSFQAKPPSAAAESALLTPPEGTNNPVEEKPELSHTNDEDFQALIDLCENNTNHSDMVDEDDENDDDKTGSKADWPFKLLSAPLLHGGDGHDHLPLIDSTELDGIMDDKPASSTATTGASKDGKRPASPAAHEHSELRKRIRLLEEEVAAGSGTGTAAQSPVQDQDQDRDALLFADLRDTTPEQVAAGGWPNPNNDRATALGFGGAPATSSSSIVW